MSKPERLAVDTSVAIYLVTVDPPRGQEDEWRAARELGRVDTDDWTLCLPAPALGEVLAGIPIKRQEDAADILCRMFEVLDYDKDAALVAGRIALAGIRGRSKTSKQAVKIDVEIVACAVRWGAKGLCATDGDHARIIDSARLTLEVGGPSRFTPPQQPLFQDDESEE